MTVIPTGADEFVLVSADEEVVVNRAGGRLEGERDPAVKQEGDEDESVVKEHDSQTDSTGSEEEQDDVQSEDEDEEDDEEEGDDYEEGDEEGSDIEGDDQEEGEDEDEEEADCCASKSSPHLCDWAWFDILLVTFFTLVLLLCLGSLVGEGMRSMAGRDGLGQQQEMERARLLWEVEEVKSMLMQQEMQQKHLQADMEQIRNTQRALHSQLMFLRQQQAGRVGQQHYNLQQHDHQQEYILKELEELRQRTGATEEAVERVMEVMVEQQRDDGLFEVLEGFDSKLMHLSSRLGWLMDELDVSDALAEEAEGGEYETEWHAHHHCC